MDKHMDKHQIGCGYCINEQPHEESKSTCKVLPRKPGENLARLGCPSFKHFKEVEDES